MLQPFQSLRETENLLAGAQACSWASMDIPYSQMPSLESFSGRLLKHDKMNWLENAILPMCGWKFEQLVVISFGGLQTVSEGQSYLVGSFNPIAAPRLVGRVNSLIVEYVRNAINHIATYYTDDYYTMIIFGHSAGGAVAHVLGAYLNATRPNWIVRAATFGSPRFADGRFHSVYPNVVKARLMGYLDPFPYAVPHTLESPLLHALIPQGSWANVNSLVLGNQGMGIDADRSIIDATYPFGVSGNLTQQALIELTRVRLGITSPHSIDKYIADLEAHVVSPLPLRQATIDVGSPVEPPPLRLSRGALNRVVEGARLQQSQVYVSRESASPGVIRLLGRGGTWTVTVFGQVVYTTKSKLDGKGVARALRGMFLQYWQRPWQFITPAGLAEALFSHPDLARPPMVTPPPP